MYNKKIMSIMQILSVQKAILEIELEWVKEFFGKSRYRIPKEDLREQVRKVEVVFGGKGIADISHVTDSLEIDDNRFEEIIKTLKNVGEITESTDGLIQREDALSDMVSGTGPLSRMEKLTKEKWAADHRNDFNDWVKHQRNKLPKEIRGKDTRLSYTFKFRFKGKQIIRSIYEDNDTKAIKSFAKECGMGKFSCEVNDSHKFTHKGGWRDKK
jgi:hypothetical protein